MNYRRLILLISLTILFSKSCFSQNRELIKLIKKIEKQEVLFIDHSLTKKTLRYASKLNRITTDKDLLNLSKNECKLCFSYAFWVLSKRNLKVSDSIFNDYKKDDIEDYKMILVNKYKKNKGCIVVLYPSFQFI